MYDSIWIKNLEVYMQHVMETLVCIGVDSDISYVAWLYIALVLSEPQYSDNWLRVWKVSSGIRELESILKKSYKQVIESIKCIES